MYQTSQLMTSVQKYVKISQSGAKRYIKSSKMISFVVASVYYHYHDCDRHVGYYCPVHTCNFSKVYHTFFPDKNDLQNATKGFLSLQKFIQVTKDAIHWAAIFSFVFMLICCIYLCKFCFDNLKQCIICWSGYSRHITVSETSKKR